MTNQTAVVLADARPGMLDTLPPWALALSGLVLLLIAGLIFWFNKEKLEDDSFILEMAGALCGIGGLFALWQGIFGG